MCSVRLFLQAMHAARAHCAAALMRVHSTRTCRCSCACTSQVAVETTGLARCAGFQTHDTPVLLAAEDRAELATDKYLPVTPLLEGFVILKKNPAYVEGDD